MKKLFTSLLISLIAISAHADNKHPLPGDKCDNTGLIEISAKDGTTLYCAKGVWQDVGTATNIAVNVIITKGEAVIYNGTTTTLDGQTAPVSVQDEISYLSKVSQLVQKDKPSTTTATPGKITTGVSINITPTVEANKKIKTNMAISIDDLISMRSIAVNDDINIEAPEVKSIKFNQIITLDQNTPATFTLDEYAVKVSAKVI